MREGSLDISKYERAVNKLGEIIQRYNQNTEDDAIRDSVIQRFEFTYSIALTTLRKYFIDRAFVIEDVNQMSFNDMIRTANQLNLLKSNLEVWSDFRRIRNMTSQAYYESIAEKVINIIPKFYEEMKYLCTTLYNSLKTA